MLGSKRGYLIKRSFLKLTFRYPSSNACHQLKFLITLTVSKLVSFWRHDLFFTSNLTDDALSRNVVKSLRPTVAIIAIQNRSWRACIELRRSFYLVMLQRFLDPAKAVSSQRRRKRTTSSSSLSSSSSTCPTSCRPVWLNDKRSIVRHLGFMQTFSCSIYKSCPLHWIRAVSYPLRRSFVQSKNCPDQM